MSLIDEMAKHNVDVESCIKRNSSKCGAYDNPVDGCPNCGRFRVMLGNDQKHRCEKCCWCIEDAGYDGEFLEYNR